jgi:hypothetical protein
MYFIKIKQGIQIQQNLNKGQLRRNLASQKHNTARQVHHRRDLRKQTKLTTHGTRGNQPSTAPDLGGEESHKHDDARAGGDSPLAILTTGKKTAPEVEAHGVDHDYTEPPPSRPE